ncbi:MAG: rRNA maturation RNase YbeY [Lachnospiraceae bacterium]|jgi:probable rRNA maturation factor|nr:rRNA maturation RNase YbeY [Lachnospiraceae bacterium]
MTYNMTEEGIEHIGIDWKPLAKRVLDYGLDFVKCPYEAEICLLLTDGEDIRELNSTFRGIDSETDVLSFPLNVFRNGGGFDDFDESIASFNPESGELLLGDIAISKNMVLLQAENYGHGVEREFAFLIAHSLLHLCGYDHENDDERLIMENKQEQILDDLGIGR